MIAYELSTHGKELVRLIEEARDSGDADLEASLTALRDSMLAEDEGATPAEFLLAMKRDWISAEALAAGAAQARDRFAAQVRMYKRLYKEAREIALMYMQARGITQQETGDVEIPFVKRVGNGGVQPVKVQADLDVSAVPRRFHKPVDPVLDLKELLKALLAGEEFPWAELDERGEHVE